MIVPDRLRNGQKRSNSLERIVENVHGTVTVRSRYVHVHDHVLKTKETLYQIFARFKSQLLASLNQIFKVADRLKIDYFVSTSNVVFLKAHTKISNLANFQKIRTLPC